MTAYQLVRFDPPGVQNLIFQTPKLKEIQAASARLENAMNEELDKLQQVHGAIPLYIAGGGGAFFVPTERREAFERELKRALASKLPGMPVVVGSEPPINLESTVAAADAASKAAWPQLPAVAASPIFGPGLVGCSSCKFGPAQMRNIEREEALCALCEAKRKDRQHTAFRAALETKAELRWRKLADDDFAQDLIDISEASHTRKGYLAVIHFDVNGMGAYFTKKREALTDVSSCADFFKHSQEVSRRMAELYATAVIDTWPEGFTHKVPAEMLYLGGDDAVMVCAPDRALQLANAATKGFATCFKTEKFTLSTGLVIARHNTPMKTLLDHAGKLNDSAKNLHYAHGGSTLDFNVLLGQSMEDLDTYRREVYTVKGACMTGRPYAIEEVPALLHEVLRLAPLSGRIWDLVEACSSLEQGELSAIQLLGRMNKHEAEALFAHFEGSGLGGLQGLPPWFRPTQKREQPYMVLRDILELLPFLEVKLEDSAP